MSPYAEAFEGFDGNRLVLSARIECDVGYVDDSQTRVKLAQRSCLRSHDLEESTLYARELAMAEIGSEASNRAPSSSFSARASIEFGTGDSKGKGKSAKNATKNKTTKHAGHYAACEASHARHPSFMVEYSESGDPRSLEIEVSNMHRKARDTGESLNAFAEYGIVVPGCWRHC